ncbi:hypothetical protein ACS8E3_07815 [Psychrobacter sp. 2Y5]|uniref:DUF1281 family ferredoxin-like fold protein n=1 Tax=unclassified Psychrobacter TaxID=196806 RepID=UPI003F456395
MPNHITNRITVIKGEYDLSTISTFNAVVPMPPALKEIEHSDVVMEVEHMLGIALTYFSERPTLPQLEAKYSEPKNKDALRQAMSNQIMYGATSWYQWSVDNWGTKWDMYDVFYNDSVNVLVFDTAWSAPMYWIEALAKSLPEGVELKVEYADEDAGNNAGIVTLSKDKCDINRFDNNSDEAWQMAVDLKNLGDLYKKVDGEWVCTED